MSSSKHIDNINPSIQSLTQTPTYP
jgi:hypothetical protein